MEEANMKYVTQFQDVEKAVSISHRDLGEEEDQEVMDDLEYEEQDEKGAGEVLLTTVSRVKAMSATGRTAIR